MANGKMRRAALLSVALLWVIESAAPASAARYVDMSTSCDGGRLASRQRVKIIGWDGRSRRVQSETVYDLRVDCDGSERHIMDLFLASIEADPYKSDRYKRDGGTLQKHAGTKRTRVKTRDAGCEKVPKQERTYPSDAEARAACRGSPTPMACELEFQNQDRWVTRMVDRCWRAQYETRHVPRWKPFPPGYAPLPAGARIVQVVEKPAKRVATDVGGDGAGQIVRTRPAPPASGGPGVLPFLLLALTATAGAVYYFRWKNTPLREQVARARRSVAQEYEGFGIHIPAKDFRKPGAGQSQADLDDELRDLNSELSRLKQSRELHGNAENRLRDLEGLCRTMNYTGLESEIDRVKGALAGVGSLSRLTPSQADDFAQSLRDLNTTLQSYIDQVRYENGGQKEYGSAGQGEYGFAGGESPEPDAPDAVPTSREEVYALLNITEDTPIDKAKGICIAMLQAWHPDQATSEKDRELREIKSKQLTAANDFLNGKWS